MPTGWRCVGKQSPGWWNNPAGHHKRTQGDDDYSVTPLLTIQPLEP